MTSAAAGKFSSWSRLLWDVVVVIVVVVIAVIGQGYCGVLLLVVLLPHLNANCMEVCRSELFAIDIHAFGSSTYPMYPRLKNQMSIL